MNYRYSHGNDERLRAFVSRRPHATLHELQQSHSALRTMSLDHLALRIDQLGIRADGAGR